MKFYKFLEEAKQGLVHTSGNVYRLDSDFYTEIPNCVPFVFTAENEAVVVDKDVQEIDLPFQTCFFEILGRPITEIKESSKGVVGVDGIFVYEYAPKNYNILLLIYEIPKVLRMGMKKSYSIYAMDSKQMGELSQHMLGVLKSLLGRIESQEAGVINPRVSIKFKAQGKKIQHRINKIVYVSPKSQKQVAQAHATKEIDWSHRFEVRGHWRKIDTVGKDRSGTYCIEGFIWVKDHVRGPDHLPVIKKTRVVHTPNS